MSFGFASLYIILESQKKSQYRYFISFTSFFLLSKQFVILKFQIIIKFDFMIYTNKYTSQNYW